MLQPALAAAAEEEQKDAEKGEVEGKKKSPATADPADVEVKVVTSSQGTAVSAGFQNLLYRSNVCTTSTSTRVLFFCSLLPGDVLCHLSLTSDLLLLPLILRCAVLLQTRVYVY